MHVQIILKLLFPLSFTVEAPTTLPITIKHGWSFKQVNSDQFRPVKTGAHLSKQLSDRETWFVPKINLKPNQTLIIFDDDQSIHQIWKDRIESLMNHTGITIRSFSEPAELKNSTVKTSANSMKHFS